VCRIRNKSKQYFSPAVEKFLKWWSIFLALCIICFGPCVGVVAAGTIFGAWGSHPWLAYRGQTIRSAATYVSLCLELSPNILINAPCYSTPMQTVLACICVVAAGTISGAWGSRPWHAHSVQTVRSAATYVSACPRKKDVCKAQDVIRPTAAIQQHSTASYEGALLSGRVLFGSASLPVTCCHVFMTALLWIVLHY